MAKLDAKGTCVIMEATHTCMTIRGAKKPGAVMVTSAMRGRLVRSKWFDRRRSALDPSS